MHLKITQQKSKSMQNKQIEILYSHEKRSLTILQDGIVVGGYIGKIAERLMKKVAFNNAKVEVKDGNVQIEL